MTVRTGDRTALAAAIPTIERAARFLLDSLGMRAAGVPTVSRCRRVCGLPMHCTSARDSSCNKKVCDSQKKKKSKGERKKENELSDTDF